MHAHLRTFILSRFILPARRPPTPQTASTIPAIAGKEASKASLAVSPTDKAAAAKVAGEGAAAAVKTQGGSAKQAAAAATKAKASSTKK